MRPEKLYLVDILEAADAILRFIEPIQEDEFLNDELRQSGVLQKLIVIGEAAARVSKDLQAKYSEVEWPDIIGFRNIAVHEYFAVMWEIVWETAVTDIPKLRNQIEGILEADFD
ncbi:MAG: DUF86 domain-containing protein [Anaerolineales bacterium]|nr:DUF86 domain-containing protein [Anaerolineales bacterium]